MSDLFASFVEVVCCDCCTEFMLPKRFSDARRGDKKQFWCPNGHAQSYTTSEADRLRGELSKKDAAVAGLREALDVKHSEIARQHRRYNGLLGLLSRYRNQPMSA